ncbi:MAG: serine/threonine protein kinase [Thermoleophilia bacterium]|nr:serine/threonine protein kinase [Thermoleophilia bacterium]
MSRVPPPLQAGAAIAPGYSVAGHLHRGDALDVYEVWSQERDCLCIAKLLRPDRVKDVRPRRRLFREGRLLQQLTHPHIVRAYETLSRPQPVLILETLSGATLAHVLEVELVQQRFPVQELAVLGLQLCSATAYLHRHRLLHLDLKPANIVAEGGRVKVIDLSLVRRPGRGRKGAGTRQYMAPEQALGRTLTEATDVWGIGATLYESAAGSRPFPSRPRVRYPQLIQRAQPAAAHRRLPRELAVAIDACLEPAPRDRPSVAELAAVLEPLA